MTTNTNLPVSSGSFEEIKQRLIQYLKGQDEFKDYDFAGSRLNVLTDLLAYNTMYMQHYSNAALYEGFIRTAQKHSSVVQHAQDLGYAPSSMTASTHTIGIKAFHAENPVEITLGTGTRFSANVDNVHYYNYIVWEPHILIGAKVDPLTPTSPLYYQANIDLVQGTLGRHEEYFTESSTITIRDPDLDRNYVRVFIDNAEWTNWTDKSIVNTTGGSNVFYLRENVDGYTEVYFGEGELTDFTESSGAYNPGYIGGLRPIAGQRVRVQYLKTQGPIANGAEEFTWADDIPNFQLDDKNIDDNPYDDENFSGSIGGGYAEGTERIRELAPIFRESQRRCVTKLDYETFVSQKFGNIVQAVQVFGGTDKPGYVFIAIKPKSGLTLPQVVRNDIEEYLSEFNIVTVTAKVVDPDYLYINHDLSINYRIGSLSEGADYLKSQIIDSISNYYYNEVEIFNASYHVSKMLTYVDDAHESILGSRCDISLIREVVNFAQTPMSGYSFLNPVVTRSVKSAEVTYIPGGYTVSIKSTDNRTAPTEEDIGTLLLGPFAAGDITDAIDPETGNVAYEYTDDDFDRETIDGRSLYYRIGTVNYSSGLMDYDFHNLGVDSSDWNVVGNLIISSLPTRTNVYTADGSLIVYENALRPQYTNIILEGIS
ncbi:hypothetical protein NVP1081O_342 [Vibrio phage 1.081.O._10N.286.52.C2]|nr:hypothetical protein NVP1081O_342 [Vibrio phage 1.081.O._10N.286.52.C2]